MKLINYELRNSVYVDVFYKVLKHAPCNSPVLSQIRKNFGWWGDNNLIRLKIHNTNILLILHI